MQRTKFALEGKDCLYNSRIKYYPDGSYKLSCFNRQIYNPNGMERCFENVGGKEKNMNNDSRSDSVKRSKERIFDIALLNDWDYFITVTFDPEKVDSLDPKAVIKKLNNWLRNAVYRKGLKYVLVPEYHQSGRIHLHGLICGDFNYINSEHKTNRGQDILNISDWTYGFSTAIALDDNKTATAKYMTKYITKDLGKIFGNFTLAVGIY